MQNLLALAALFLSTSFARADTAPLHLNNMYFGNFSLTPRADGKFDFRSETFGGDGVETNVDSPLKFGHGIAYAVSGVVQCQFGVPASQVFDCNVFYAGSPRTVTIEVTTNGQTVKQDLRADYITVSGSEVTTHDLWGTRSQTVVETVVLDQMALSIDLTQNF